MTEEKPTTPWISGFWRRIGALIIDTFVLGTIGQLLGLLLESSLVAIGVWGRLVGFVIALLYFGILNSKIGKGQTLGKKLLKIRVVNTDNDLISLTRSCIRYSLLAIPFSLNGAAFSDGIMTSFFIYILSLLVFGGLASIIYLYVFNRRTRQSLHDLIAGTFVVNAMTEKQTIRDIWKPHYAIVTVFLVTALLIPIFTGSLTQKEPFIDLMNSRKALMEQPAVKNASISYNTSKVYSSNSDTTTTTNIIARVYLAKNETSNQELAESMAISVLKNYPESHEKDAIVVQLVYGFDIGIASRWHSFNHLFNPTELSKIN